MSSNGNIVKLNIGGTVFQTTKSTLTRYDGFFKTMLETEIPVAKDDADCIFVDRSAKHFDKILNFMRDGHVASVGSIEKFEEIRNEAHYYLLDGLAEFCEREIEKMVEKSELKSIFDGDVKVLETNGQVLQVTEKSEKLVLIIYYHVDDDGRFIRPDGFYIQNFVKKHKHHLDIYFKSFTNAARAQSTGSSAVSWHWSLHGRGAYLYGWPQYSSDRELKNGESFEEQLENTIERFFQKVSLVL